MASKCANVQIVAMSLDYAQGWEFALLLLSLFTKRATRANHSRRSLHKGQQERIAPIALNKKSNKSESLPSLF